MRYGRWCGRFRRGRRSWGWRMWRWRVRICVGADWPRRWRGGRGGWMGGGGRRVGGNGPWGRLPLTYVRNCAECIGALCEHPKAVGETFNIVDGETVRAWRFARQYARRTGRISVPMPYFVGLLLAVFASV